MKKIVLVIALTMIALLLFAGLASAGGEKVAVCHINAANDVVESFLGSTNDIYFGKEISVSPNAVEAHEAHGDVGYGVWFGADAAGPIAAFQAAGVHLPAADCYIGVAQTP